MKSAPLKTLDLASVRPFYDEPVEASNAGAGLKEDRKLTVRHQRHKMLNLTRVANAAAALERLPEPGESFHIVCRGNWHGWALVPAMIRLAGGEPLRSLHVATLGFARDNGEELLSLLDAGTVRAASVVISCYFRSNESELVGWLAHEMKQRGQKFAAVRNHAKVIALEFERGAAIAVESSANLRSCRNVEQFTITHNRALVAFHQQWMEAVLAGGDDK